MNDTEFTLEDFARTVIAGAEDVCKAFTGPDDDFDPVMQFLPGEDAGVVLMQFDGNFLRNGDTKDALAQHMMVPMIRGTGAVKVAYILSAWSLAVEGLPEQEARAAVERAMEEGLANHPNRREQVIVNTLDGDNIVCYFAEIHRDGTNPPTLGEWECMNDQFDHFDGRFVDPLQAALKQSTGKPDPEFLAAMKSKYGV